MDWAARYWECIWDGSLDVQETEYVGWDRLRYCTGCCMDLVLWEVLHGSGDLVGM